MPINKVDFAGQTLIDLTKDTVTAEKLLKGITAHDKAGNPISGTASGPKPEQEKEITISENGDYPITPDMGKVLSKVLAHVNVSGGGGDIEVKTGEYIPAGTIDNETVTIDTGVTKGKNLFCIWTLGENRNTVTVYSAIFKSASDEKYSAYAWEPGYKGAPGYVHFSPGSKVVFETDDVGEGLFRAGMVYRWICVAGIPYDFMNVV